MEAKDQLEINPDKKLADQALAQNIARLLYNPADLLPMIRRKIRSHVTIKLRDEHGQDYAENHWLYECGRIVTAHLAKTYPEVYGKLASADQIEKIQNNYPWELQIMATITNLIEEGKSIQQIEGMVSLK